MKLKYPVETFALLFIIASDTLRNSIVFGILFLVLLLCGYVITELAQNIIPALFQKLILWISLPSLTYVFFRLTFYYLLKEEIPSAHFLLFLVAGGYLAMFYSSNLTDSSVCSEQAQILKIVTEDTVFVLLKDSLTAYGILLLTGAARELLSKGSLLHHTILDAFFVTNTFDSIITGFLFAGIGLSLVHVLLQKGSEDHDSLWVIIPVILLFQPFTIESVNEVIGFLIAVIVPIVFIISVRKHLIFSCMSRSFKKVPIELVSMGFIYMILKAF